MCCKNSKIEVNLEVERKLLSNFKTKKNMVKLQKGINRF